MFHNTTEAEKHSNPAVRWVTTAFAIVVIVGLMIDFCGNWFDVIYRRDPILSLFILIMFVSVLWSVAVPQSFIDKLRR